ncbi:hypothetical protein NliqN6_1514 [Naganishia liquefaciens]|uniref:HIT-type domain-containing protein n=1 Tax=Naganishia liquefaciens TaxID=104408 RepID=A0A8H3TQ13_9TREE|nr:hypothetical protein NliqN6_1514 [Naganishia liquefaciens]
MSLRYPSKTVKLPFNAPDLSTSGSGDEHGFLPTKRTYTTSQIEQTTCGICGKKQSKYVCPRCNVFYCSLDCFRDEKHVQCSEPFYSSAIREAIQLDSASSAEEKRKMMEMLARFERRESEGGNGSDANGLEELLRGMGLTSGKQESVNEDAEADEGFDALEMLKLRLDDGADLDNMDLQGLLDLLPPSHRERFLSLVSDPDSDQVHQLLQGLDERERKEVEGGSVPWFMLEERGDLEREGEDDLDRPVVSAMVKPSPASDDIIQGINVDPSVASKLLYNILAICLAYVQVLITHSLPSLAHAEDPRRSNTLGGPEQSITESILKLAPFLSDPKSAVRFDTFRDAWQSVWDHVEHTEASRLDNGDQLKPLVTYLGQLQNLVMPSLDISKGREQGLDLALSDVHAFLSNHAAHPVEAHIKGSEKQRTEDKENRRRKKIITFAAKKLAFYLAAIRSVREHYGRKVWLELSQEVGKEIEALRAEFQEEVVDLAAKDEASAEREGIVKVGFEKLGPSSITPWTGEPTQARIEEL